MTAAMSVIKKLQTYIASYCHFADPSIIRPLALWIAGTYMYEAFDAYPYLTITAFVKRAGKTRLSELIGFTCSMPFRVAGATAASLFRTIKDNKPTIIWDEAETLSSEASTTVRAFLNVGYRKGQTIPRVGENGVTEWPTYCPKVFVLIGDVYDTLRDRSIIVQMQRGEPKKRFNYETAKAEGLEIAEELRTLVADNLEKITDAYADMDLNFLTDRDEEIWRPIFALQRAIDNVEQSQMNRVAVDMATEKTSDARKHSMTEQADAEKNTEYEEYSRRLLSDMLRITAKMKAVESNQAITLLKGIDVSPWRKFRGTGLDSMKTLSELLVRVELRPKVVRDGTKVFRGYTRKDIIACARKYGVQ